MVLTKKTKNVLAFALSLSVVATCMAPLSAAAYKEGDSSTLHEKDVEKYGDSTYANRFMSLYADVMENGVENGYLSQQGSNKIPYHCVETLNVEAPDYGHETTSEAMSYLVWIAAMRDNLVNNGIAKSEDGFEAIPSSSSELATAWKDMEVMIPTEQSGFWQNASSGSLSATYSDELDTPEEYPIDMLQGNTGTNPIQKFFTQAYSSDKGLYLMHWLADVNDWYGFGGATPGTESGKFTFINTFQRGAQESCWETVPFPCIEELKYGEVGTRGIKGIFNTDAQVAKQWAYTNAPDAEDRAIQGVHDAIRWGVADNSVVELAGKMGDELRNNMFDKYYKAIGEKTQKWDGSESVYDSAPSSGYTSAHYLMNWYTSWGGALDGSWSWQIGCSHNHEFYQNPLAAYALLNDSELNSAMKATNATTDYQTSLARQLEFYLWLQSNDGPIAGGATNSLYGRYEDYSKAYTLESDPSALVTSQFYGMIYLEHPVYADPGSNHWIGNQVWALQRIAELYYDTAVGTDNTGVTLSNGMTVKEACAKIMDKWVKWSVDNIKFDEEAAELLEIDDTTTWAIPGSLDWSGQPDTWTGTPTDNTGLTCSITAWSREVGSSASWADGLIYYAAACGVDTNTSKTADELIASSDLGEQALGVAKKILDYQWEDCRDEIGLTVVDVNSNLTRFFEQTVWIPNNYNGTMPNGDTLANGATFHSIRTMYDTDPDYERLKADYDADGATTDTIFYYHRFWHEGDALIANGVMATLFPNMTPDNSDTPDTPDKDLELKDKTVEVAVGDTKTIGVSTGTVTSWVSADDSIATVDENGVVTGVKAGETTITATDANGNTAEVKVTVTETTTETSETTTSDTEETTTSGSELGDAVWGDCNVDDKVSTADLVAMKKHLLGITELTDEGKYRGDVNHDGNTGSERTGKISTSDLLKLKKYFLGMITADDLAHA